LNRIFVTSDTHFGHKKIIEFEAKARPYSSIKDHDEDLIKRWNSVVTPNDTVWHLGDVLFGRDGFNVVRRLNGVKKLVMGNHDRYPTALYLEHFNLVCGSVEVRNFLLTHIPIHPSQFRRYRGNIHGHLHSRKMEDNRYINVSVEQTNLAPILLDTVIHNWEVAQSAHE
jgi:calcineurin-like phosphoesterase family protein